MTRVLTAATHALLSMLKRRLYAQRMGVGDIRNRDWVAAQLDDGATVTAIARDAGVSRQTARTWLARHRLDPIDRAKTRPTPARLTTLYQRYGSTTRVAAELGVSTDTARRWLIDAGVELAPAGRPRLQLDVEALRSRRRA